MPRVTSCPREGSAARNICSLPWATESVQQSEPRYVWPCQRFRPWTGPGCDSRTLSAVCEFSLCLSLFSSKDLWSNPTRNLWWLPFVELPELPRLPNIAEIVLFTIGFFVQPKLPCTTAFQFGFFGNYQ